MPPKHHWILQSKGGVGKSMVASFLVQYFKGKGLSCHCYDIDASNQTFAGFKEFGVVSINIKANGDEIDPRRFDDLMELLLRLGDNEQSVIDSGAASFESLGCYLRDNNALELLQAQGHEVYIHSVVTGGQGVVDTSLGLATSVINFPSVPVVVWLNSYFGEIALDDRASFEEFDVYKKHSDRFHAVIQLPQKKQATFGRDIEMLLAKKQSFAAGINSSAPVMVRQRLSQVWRELCGIMDMAQLY